MRVLASLVLGAGLAAAAVACTSTVAVPSYAGSTPTATSPTPPPNPEFSIPTRVSEEFCLALDGRDNETVSRIIFEYATPSVVPYAVGLVAMRQSCPERLPQPAAVAPPVAGSQTPTKTSGDEQLEYLCSRDPSMPECP